MSKARLKMSDRTELYHKTGGLCSICCERLDYDYFARNTTDIKEYAHIIADSENWTRGDAKKSQIYAGDINNIILLCPNCHTKVDRDEVFYTVEHLHTLRAKHIEKVRKALDALKNTEAFVVKYVAPIGGKVFKIDEGKMNEAVANSGFISHELPITLNPNNTAYTDKDPKFWETELAQLTQNYKAAIEARLIREDMKPFLLFAIAPQPLLVKLGTLMNDAPDVHVYQKRREPDTWCWSETAKTQEYQINLPTKMCDKIAVKLSLSDTISNDRITSVLGSEISIWEITHAQPHNDFIKHPTQLAELRKTYREFFRLIRETHGQQVDIHVFFAAPVSATVEFGRVWMPKADANMKLYDQNKIGGNNRFDFAFEITGV